MDHGTSERSIYRQGAGGDMSAASPSQTRSTATLTDIDQELAADYKPFEHRHIPHPSSTLGSFFNLLKSSLGSGLLAMPAAFKHAGLVPGCVGTVLVAVIATHCVHILVRTAQELCKECKIGSLSYTETCERAFKHGPKCMRPFSYHVRIFADYAMAGVCLGGTSVYVIFVASSLKDIFDHFIPEHTLSVIVYCVILLIPLIMITQLRYLKFLVPFSLFANICLLLTFVITCYYTFTGETQLSEIKLVANVLEWPLFLSTAIFAMEGINVVMPVENEMAEPQHFLGCFGVLNCTMLLVAVLYGFVGVSGYLKYGDKVLGSITLNLPQDEILALAAKILVALAVLFTYCLQMYAPMNIIWAKLKQKITQKYHNIAQIALRTASVLFTVLLAVVVPDLELLIGFVGAIFFSTLGLFIPVAIETVYRWEKGLGRYNYVLWKNILLLFFYLLVLSSGCYVSISQIVVRFSR